MKHAVKPLLVILSAVGLCSCESLPSTDPFDRDVFVSRGGFVGRGGFVPSRDQALYGAYNERLNEVGVGSGNIEKMNAFYSSNW
jgi:hypothetical protein